jgi:hypothetical protein
MTCALLSSASSIIPLVPQALPSALSAASADVGSIFGMHPAAPISANEETQSNGTSDFRA